MTKTNSLKKALAGILAACMAATTLVAAPFTFGNSQNVGAASLDEMELLAQYSFESGYTDSVSGKSGTLDETTTGTISLQKDKDNTYMSVGSSGNDNNVIQVANPFKGDAASDMTIAMKVRVNESNNFEGLWAIVNAPAGSWVGLCGTGGFHYNYPGIYRDYPAEANAAEYNGSIPVDSQWHEVVTTITATGDLTLYVDGESKYTINDSTMMTGFYQYDYLLIGSGASSLPSWGSSTADYDDVRFYSGAADADAVVAIYKEAAPEALASYTFDDASSIEGLTSVGASVVTDDVQGCVLKIEKNTTSNNYVRLNNPLYQKEASDFTIAMNVLLEEDTDAYRGLWSFSNEAGNVGYFGMSRNGGLRYNGYLPAGEANHWYNTAGYGLGEDTSWHKLAVVVSAEDGTAKIYLDGTLTGTMDASSTFDSYGDAGVDIAKLLADVPEYVTKQQYFFLGFASGSNWMTNGASYDNVAIYGRALTALEIANLPGTVPSASEEEPEPPVDLGEPIPISRDAVDGVSGWQVINGDSSQKSTIDLTDRAVGNNYSIYGWFKVNGTAENMHLYEQISTPTSYYGTRLYTNGSGELVLCVENSSSGAQNIATGYNLNDHLNQAFFLTVNYDYDNNTVSLYIDGEEYISRTGILVRASSLTVSQMWLGYSFWSNDPVLKGSAAGVYYSNAIDLPNSEAIQAYMKEHQAPTTDLDRLEYATAPVENLNIVEGNATYVQDPNGNYVRVRDENGNYTYVKSANGNYVKDADGNYVLAKISKVDGNAKAMLSTEKYTQETLAATDDARYSGTPGYRAFDVSKFLSQDDFAVTSWVRWYGDGSTSWGGTQSLQAQRFFDLFDIDKADQSKYEFYFNGWEENFYQRNPSVSSKLELQEGIDELKLYVNNPNVASAEAGVYLCGITAGATMNGLSRPCFRPGLTFNANGGKTNSGLPYQWTHIAVVYDADGHQGSNGSVYGASLTYYVDGAAYAVRYFDYADFDETEDAFYQNNSDPKNAAFVESGKESSYDQNQVVGGSLDGADIIYNTTAEQLKVKNMALDTLYLGGSTVSTALWNGQYQNAYLYNYALTSGEVSEDYVDLVKPLEGASMETPTEANNITTDGNIYALINESANASKTMELGFNTEWLNTSAYRGTSSLSFNGDGGYAEVDTSLLTTDGQPIKEDGSNVSDQFTFSTWVNLSDTLNWGRIFDIKGDNGELFLSNNGYFNNDANVGLGLRSSTLENGIEVDKIDVSNGTSINAGTWVNVTVVIDGTDVSLYFQGELEITGKLTMPLSEMGIHTFYLSRSAAVDGKYGLPLDPDNDMVLDETYLVQDALSDAQVLQLAKYGYAGAKTSTTQENSTRLEMLDVADLFDADRNVDTYYVDITDHKTLSAEVMNALANSTGKTLYVRVEQGVSYDFIWELTSEAFAGRTYSASDEFDLLVSGANMSSADATIILNAYMEQLRVTDPSASVHLQAQTITVYADKLPVELPLFINYNRDFLQTVDNGDGTQTLKDVPLNLYKGTAFSYSLVQKGLKAATDQDGNTLMQNYTNPTTNANGTVVQYYVQNLTEGGSFILTPQTLP